MTDQEMRDLCKRFFDAVEAGNIAGMGEIYAPNAKIWHNTDNHEQTREENLASLSGSLARLKTREYADRRVNVFPGGFVQQHTLKATRQDGSKAELIAVIVCKVENNKITRLDEYFDSAAVARFRGEAK
jgi:ketosteroid isomerase-like protein